MKSKTSPQTQETAQDQSESRINSPVNRRSFLKNSAIAASSVAGAGLLASSSQALAEESHGHITRGDAAILRFLAAAEIIETDMWQQYNELAGIVDEEVPGGTVIPDFVEAVAQL